MKISPVAGFLRQCGRDRAKAEEPKGSEGNGNLHPRRKRFTISTKRFAIDLIFTLLFFQKDNGEKMRILRQAQGKIKAPQLKAGFFVALIC